MKPEVAIVGAGAVGLALASGLLAAGWRVTFVLREGAGPHPLEHAGLTRSGILGESTAPVNSFTLLRGVAGLRGSQPGCLLVCTKTTASQALAEELGPVFEAAAPMPPLVLCQNGWGNAEIFAARLPRDRIFNARIITGFRRRAANAVEVTVHADAIRMGSLFGADPACLAPLCAAISRGGIPCEISREIGQELWAKMLYNGLLNPLGALTRAPYGALGERAETRAILHELAHEIFAVMQAAGFRSRWPSARAYLETFYAELLPATARHESSMLQDLRAGRPTEIDSLCGELARLGDRHGVETPLCDALTCLIHAAEARGPEPGA